MVPVVVPLSVMVPWWSIWMVPELSPKPSPLVVTVPLFHRGVTVPAAVSRPLASVW